MRSRFSNRGPAGTSFFAFQDIITGTTGVLIVITVFLALNIQDATSLSEDSDGPAFTLQQLQEKLREVAAMQKQVENGQGVSLDDEVTLQRMLRGLRDSVAGITRDMERLEEIPNVVETRSARETRMNQQRLLAEIQAKTTHLQAAEAAAAAAALRLSAMESDVKDAESSVQQQRDKGNTLRLIPERSATSKEPLLVLMQGSGMTISRFDRAGVEKVDGVAGLLAALKKYPQESHYVVFYCRPSAASSLMQLKRSVRSEGFEIGYDLIPESLQIEFSSQ